MFAVYTKRRSLHEDYFGQNTSKVGHCIKVMCPVHTKSRSLQENIQFVQYTSKEGHCRKIRCLVHTKRRSLQEDKVSSTHQKKVTAGR